jgi:sterol desaturase/sphingolipid hydroxylase (fatty acid hydroxylase superfamily)
MLTLRHTTCSILASQQHSGWQFGPSLRNAVHGWIVANHRELMEKGLKVVKSMPYDFAGSGDASIRSSLIYLVGMTLYAFVPMWHGTGETWAKIIFEFLLGYLILLIGGDAWFFMVHYMAHTPQLYALMHKTHHKWKYPTAFSAYYITSGTHFVQEHLFTIPALLFLPVPSSAFLFYQYYGVPAAQINHCGFNLDAVRIPFCGTLTLGNIMSVCGLGLTHILGSQTIAAHDYHHETFMGNFQLSYSYLDKLFGVYVNPKARLDIEDGLLGV